MPVLFYDKPAYSITFTRRHARACTFHSITDTWQFPHRTVINVSTLYLRSYQINFPSAACMLYCKQAGKVQSLEGVKTHVSGGYANICAFADVADRRKGWGCMCSEKYERERGLQVPATAWSRDERADNLGNRTSRMTTNLWKQKKRDSVRKYSRKVKAERKL
jgi:hypothetical protein